MGCDELIQAIGRESCSQCEAILAQAAGEADRIVREAEARRGATLEQARARGAAQAQREAARIRSRARIEAKREVLAARYEMIEAALRALEERLRLLGGDAAYREILESLVAECLAEAPGPATVRCRPEDRTLVEDCARRLDAQLAVEEAPFPLGGVELAFGEGGELVCRNGFADRMEKSRPLLLQEAARFLFGPAVPEAPP